MLLGINEHEDSDFLNSPNKKITSNFLRRLAAAAANLWESPVSATILAAFVYAIISIIPNGLLFRQSTYPYFNYLADAFLHGQTSLRFLPPSQQDLSFFNDKLYLYWGPFPAILLMPFVAIFGLKLNDVLYTLLIAALNVGLVAQLLRVACHVGFLNISKLQRAILVFFFALGTVHVTIASCGRVWFTAQIIGFTCVLLAYLAAFSLKGAKAWFLTGLALACAMLTRTQMVFTGIFPLIWMLTQERKLDWKKVIGKLSLASLPLLVALSFNLIYNQSRFGSPFEVGLTYHLLADHFWEDFEKFGPFNIHYLPINFYYQYIFYPLPLRLESANGGSLFLLSPVFFGAFAAFKRPRNKTWIWSLVASIMIVNIPILLLMGTGWVQFGPRYTLDFTVPLLLLTALGIEKWKPGILFFLALVSSVQYLIGANLLVDL